MAKPLRQIYQLKVTLKEVKPPVWRRLLVASNISLSHLHHALQIAMGWTDSHLHQFVHGSMCYGEPDPDLQESGQDERKFRLDQLLKKEKDWLRYEYDFGDGWEHRVVLEKVLPFEPSAVLPACVDGKRACPPEDCGGPWGYEELLQTLSDPSDPEREEMLEWIGEDFDPEEFDLEEVIEILEDFCR